MRCENILVTGVAGFIGYHLSKKLLEEGFNVIGLDNLNSYYEVSLKKERLKQLVMCSQNRVNKWEFLKIDINNKEDLNKIFMKFQPKIVINLAAQAGVRYSLENPKSYIDSNIIGFHNILSCCKEFNIKNLIYASSSSVYGGNTKIPFSEKDQVNHPVSLYAATKKANELFAHTYSHLYGISCIGVRFFTVYGPWGRPDMAPMIFTKAILSKKPIRIFNHGNMFRDFTFIDDAVDALLRLIEKPATPNLEFKKDCPDPSSSWCSYRIFNIGNNKSISIMDFIGALEKELGIAAIKKFEPMQKGDVERTFANTEDLEKYIGYKPNTSLEIGLNKFIKWYRNFYNLS